MSFKKILSNEAELVYTKKKKRKTVRFHLTNTFQKHLNNIRVLNDEASCKDE